MRRTQRLAPELDRSTTGTSSGTTTAPLLRHRGLYADQLARYLAVFPVHQILVLTSDETAPRHAGYGRSGRPTSSASIEPR